MDDKEKIKAAITMLKQLKKMVGFFMKKDISELIEKLEETEKSQESRAKNQDVHKTHRAAIGVAGNR